MKHRLKGDIISRVQEKRKLKSGYGLLFIKKIRGNKYLEKWGHAMFKYIKTSRGKCKIVKDNFSLETILLI